MDTYYVYILASKKRTALYCGVTNNLERRLFEHRNGMSSFTARYFIHHLVWVQEFSNPLDAICAEKRIKKMLRAEKESLISQMNPMWDDLAEG